MSLTKTLNPAGVLVEVNGKTLDNPQVIEDMVDDIAAASPSSTVSALALNAHGTPTITVAAQAGATRDATIQLKDGAGVNLAEKAHAHVWLSDAAAGALTAGDPAGGVSFTAGTRIGTSTMMNVLSTAAGAITIRLTDATSPLNTTWYVNVAIGTHVVSAAVNITNA